MSDHDKLEPQSQSKQKQSSPDIQSPETPNIFSLFKTNADGTSNLQRKITGSNSRVKPQQLVMLQRTLGNQALLRMMDNQKSAQPDPIQTTTTPDDDLQLTRVRNRMRDGPYGWTSQYDAEFLDFDDYGGICNLELKVRIRRGRGVTAEEQATVEQQASDAFIQYFNNRFALVDVDNMKRYYLIIFVNFVTSGQDGTVRLRAGSGRDDSSTWYVDSDPIDRAHELGHLIGLRDEYVDNTVPNRRRANSPGVHSDNSLMGDYPNEGPDNAVVHQRHADKIAGDIGRATRRTLIATTRAAAEGMYGAGLVESNP